MKRSRSEFSRSLLRIFLRKIIYSPRINPLLLYDFTVWAASFTYIQKYIILQVYLSFWNSMLSRDKRARHFRRKFKFVEITFIIRQDRQPIFHGDRRYIMETSKQRNRVLINFLALAWQQEAVAALGSYLLAVFHVSQSRRRALFYSRSINPHRRVRRSTEIRLLGVYAMCK